MISNELLKSKILDAAIHGKLVDNDLSLHAIDVEEVTEDTPFDIPSNWKWLNLKKCCFKLYAGGDKTSEFSKTKTDKYLIPVVANGITNDGIIGYTDVPTETETCLTISGRGTIGYTSVRNYPFSPVVRLITIAPQDFLNIYYLKFVMSLLVESSKGTSIQQLTIPMIKNKLIPIPPLEEQQRIVDKIEELFELIDRKTKNDQENDKLKILLKDKILDSAIHGELIDNDSSLPSVDVEGITEDIPFEIPSNWGWTLFDSISVIVRGGSPRPIKDYLTDANDGINWIKIGDTNPNEYYINTVKEKIKPEGRSKSRFVEKGSLLLTNSMSFGRPYILNVDGCIHDGWLNIKDRDNYFDSMYMVYLLSSKYFYNVMCDKSSGAVVSNLNIDKVKSLRIPLPPLEEQHKIVDKIEECFDLIDKL